MKMKRYMKALLSLSVAVAAAFTMSGCGDKEEALSSYTEASVTASAAVTSLTETEALSRSTDDTASEEVVVTEATVQEAPQETEPHITTAAEAESAPPPITSLTPDVTDPPENVDKVSVEKDGSYTTPEDVAEYIHTFGTLPQNFITKSEAQALGWDSSKGNLWEVAEGMSIGGDRFGNYEGLLPTQKGRKYTECDVNYSGGYRGGERIIFSNDGLIYYTNDHYKSFTQLY